MPQFQALEEDGTGSGSSASAPAAAAPAADPAKPTGAVHAAAHKGGDGKSPISGAVFNLANAVRFP